MTNLLIAEKKLDHEAEIVSKRLGYYYPAFDAAQPMIARILEKVDLSGRLIEEMRRKCFG